MTDDTIYLATIRGKKNVLAAKVAHSDSAWVSLHAISGHFCHNDSDVTERREVIVVNKESVAECDLTGAIAYLKRSGRFHGTASLLTGLLNMTSPKIPEPPVFSVVEASLSVTDSHRALFVRVSTNSWRNTMTGTCATWDELFKPVLKSPDYTA